jgi:hypothetical protein
MHMLLCSGGIKEKRERLFERLSKQWVASEFLEGMWVSIHVHLEDPRDIQGNQLAPLWAYSIGQSSFFHPFR